MHPFNIPYLIWLLFLIATSPIRHWTVLKEMTQMLFSRSRWYAIGYLMHVLLMFVKYIHFQICYGDQFNDDKHAETSLESKRFAEECMRTSILHQGQLISWQGQKHEEINSWFDDHSKTFLISLRCTSLAVDLCSKLLTQSRQECRTCWEIAKTCNTSHLRKKDL